MSKSVMIIDTPTDCCECPFGTMAFGKSICLLDEGNGIDCPLKPYKDFIPVEWIVKWTCEFIDPNSEGYKMAMELVHDWRKENGRSE